MADQKAENNFHIIMGMIKYQSLMKQGKLKMQQEKAKEGDQAANIKNKKDKFSEDFQAQNSDNEDNLITYWEFINAIKALKNLHRKVLPRTLSFKEVLGSIKTETEFSVSDTNADDFAMFRYEINSIFKLHQFKEEQPTDLFIGKKPLSKNKNGKQLRDLDEASKELYQDMFRPPGLIRVRNEYFDHDKPNHVDINRETIEAQNFGNTKDVEQNKQNFKQKVEKGIWMTVPSKVLFLRENIDSEFLMLANAQRFDKIEQTYWEEYQRKQAAKGNDTKK